MMLDSESRLHALAGLLVDARSRLALALISTGAIGVSVFRLDRIPALSDLDALLQRGKWVVVQRTTGDSLYASIPDSEDVETFQEDGASPEARESAQLAIEIGLTSWPEWSPHLRGVLTPRWIIPFPTGEQSEN